MSDLAEIMHAIAARDEYVDLKIAAAIRDARNAALEEAANVCERRFMGDHNREDMEARRCAAAIRALIPKEPT